MFVVKSVGGEMVTEKRMQRILDRVIKGIRIETDILNSMGVIVASSDILRIGSSHSILGAGDTAGENQGFTYDGRTYLRFCTSNNRTYYLSMRGTQENIRNYCFMIVSLIELYLKTKNLENSREEFLRDIIQGQTIDLDFQAAMKKYNIHCESPRCVLVIRTEAMDAIETRKIMANIFPDSMEDFFVLIDSKTIALVKTIQEEMEEEELIQLGEAIEDTLLSESPVKAHIGIGSVKDNIYEIADSYTEALQAIDIGLVYDPEEKVYLFNSLLLERFLSEIPLNISGKYCRLIFKEEYNKILTPEMIATIENFFKNNLNLSETSRQLYIHRNTLVYRLDKIQNSLGLDLRDFHHAVSFKIMMMLKRQNRESGN